MVPLMQGVRPHEMGVSRFQSRGHPGGCMALSEPCSHSYQIEKMNRDEELGRLVPLGSTPRGASTCGLSTSWSTRGLTEGRTHLWTGFPLRCFQRLSEPDSATGRCRWSTTRAPEVRPPRSSRTRGSLHQFSCAHGG